MLLTLLTHSVVLYVILYVLFYCFLSCFCCGSIAVHFMYATIGTKAIINRVLLIIIIQHRGRCTIKSCGNVVSGVCQVYIKSMSCVCQEYWLLFMYWLKMVVDNHYKEGYLSLFKLHFTVVGRLDCMLTCAHERWF